MIGNFFVLLATLWFNLSRPTPPAAAAFPGGNGSAGSNKNLDAVAGV